MVLDWRLEIGDWRWEMLWNMGCTTVGGIGMEHYEEVIVGREGRNRDGKGGEVSMCI